jgi:N-acyl-D-aspartate/D-glutamate deacylase
MAGYDIIIKGGTIVDGTRAPRYVSDIAIKDGKVAKIGGLKQATAAKVLDASGLIVAPGFVDLHTHYDAQLFWDPYCSLSGWHGVTSVVIGNCGFGFAPCRVKDQERAMLALTRTEAIPYDAMKEGMKWDWVTFPEFMDTLSRIPKAVNVKTLVPLAPLYGWVMGWEEAKKRRPTEAELKEMCRLLNEAMDAGAAGWSAQVLGQLSVQRDYDGTPMCTDLMTEEELITFAKVLAERDEGFIELTLAVNDGIGTRLEDQKRDAYERIATAAKRPVLYQAVSVRNSDLDLHRQQIRWLEDCAERGIPIYGQGVLNRAGFEFTFEDWNLFDGSPAWIEATMGTPAERKAKMQDPEIRRRLREETDAGVRTGVGDVQGLVVAEVVNPKLECYRGMTIKNIATSEERHVIDVLLDIVVADDLETELFSPPENNITAEYTAEVVRSVHVNAGLSDGGAHVKFFTSGSYPTEVLTWLVRDEKVVSLEEAHYKLSYLSAFLGGFYDRGTIRQGAPADIVVYDLANLEASPSEVARDFPANEWRRIQKAIGYRWIMVNGQITLEDGEPTEARPGILVRQGGG